MRSRRWFIKAAGSISAGALLSGQRSAAEHGRAAALDASWRVGRIPLIEVEGIRGLAFGLRVIQSTRGFEQGRCLPMRISAARAYGNPRNSAFVNYDYGDTLLNCKWGARLAGNWRAVCYGTEGTLTVRASGWVIHWSDGRTELATEPADGSGYPDPDSEILRLTAALQRLASISHRFGREVRFDPPTGTFPGHTEANSLLIRTAEEGICLPVELC